LSKYRIFDTRDIALWKPQICRALAAINRYCPSRYTADVVFEHLARRVHDQYTPNAVWLYMETEQLAHASVPGFAVVGFATVDIAYDEIGAPLVFLSRAWTEPGIGKQMWEITKPKLAQWGKQFECVDLLFQTRRDTAFAKWLKEDGAEMCETNFRMRL
jgi:hypothetical protein